MEDHTEESKADEEAARVPVIGYHYAKIVIIHENLGQNCCVCKSNWKFCISCHSA